MRPYILALEDAVNYLIADPLQGCFYTTLITSITSIIYPISITSSSRWLAVSTTQFLALHYNRDYWLTLACI